MSESAQSVTHVAVLGAGTIGASWSALFLASGRSVAAYDPAENAEAMLRDYIETAWPTLERLGLTERGDPTRLSFHRDPAEAVSGAQFIQENAPERLDVKHQLYGAIEEALAPGAVVSTSTSGLTLSALQEGWRDPGGLVLGHPFNPPHLIPLVELMGNGRTRDGAVDLAEAFYRDCGKETIRLNKEVPGHVANRLQAALWREAIHLVAEGVASLEDIDKAVTAGPGLRWAVMGPHMLFNLGGGPGGMQAFCDHLGPAVSSWWSTLGSPTLTPEVVAALTQGVKDEEAGRDFKTLAAERDEKLVAIMEAFRALQARD